MAAAQKIRKLDKRNKWQKRGWNFHQNKLSLSWLFLITFWKCEAIEQLHFIFYKRLASFLQKKSYEAVEENIKKTRFYIQQQLKQVSNTQW